MDNSETNPTVNREDQGFPFVEYSHEQHGGHIWHGSGHETQTVRITGAGTNVSPKPNILTTIFIHHPVFERQPIRNLFSFQLAVDNSKTCFTALEENNGLAVMKRGW